MLTGAQNWHEYNSKSSWRVGGGGYWIQQKFGLIHEYYWFHKLIISIHIYFNQNTQSDFFFLKIELSISKYFSSLCKRTLIYELLQQTQKHRRFDV